MYVGNPSAGAPPTYDSLATIWVDDMEGADPGWTLSGSANDWEWGPPQGLGSASFLYFADPTSAYSGVNVRGTDLSVDGDHANNLNGLGQ